VFARSAHDLRPRRVRLRRDARRRERLHAEERAAGPARHGGAHRRRRRRAAGAGDPLENLADNLRTAAGVVERQAAGAGWQALAQRLALDSAFVTSLQAAKPDRRRR
jgi:hypothetical protein